jgi:hypothetical protein
MTEATVSDSPFRHLFLSNDAPNDEEVAEIRKICAEHDSALGSLNQEIERVEEQLRQLQLERERILAASGSHKSLLSPLRRIFPELLQYIFTLCLPRNRNPVMHRSEAPLLFGRVCRGWRALAYGTAILWSSIHVVVPTSRKEPRDWRVLLDGMKAWLARSSPAPLRISIFVL